MEQLRPILALDVGNVNIGIAISDKERIFAMPLAVIKRDGNEIEVIKNIITEREVEEIVVGLPKTLSGTIGPQANIVLDFLDELKKVLPEVKFVTWDERYTSVITHKMLRFQGIRSKKERKIKDKFEALLILESYLEFLRRQKREEENG
ncbi:Holliday junction resolvase RuvX [Caldisericum sp. AR60]|uniref:Holliday junction resolvase RuvX n=1 Tax=Caldisericum sp. AR60 TaxID=3397852 RepID=UPI0039FC5AF3